MTILSPPASSARRSLVLSLCFIGLTVSALAEPKIDIPRHKPCNLFATGQPAQFVASLRGFGPGSGQASAVITNYFGEKKSFKYPVQTEAGKAASLTLDLGLLEPGYYDLAVTVNHKPATGPETSSATAPLVNFGVVHMIDRSSAQAREEGSRFGLKLFQIGDEGIWWNRSLTWDLAEVVDACTKIGLQWTRHQFNQGPHTAPGNIGTLELINEHPMNVVLKIEGFPESCFDVARYGTIAEWTAAKKKPDWSRRTVPKKEPYQRWLREKVAALPKEQNIFEIGNEVWEYMPGDEFAEWCQMTLEAIKAERPDAKVGADPGAAEFGQKFLAAGGMKGMDIWYNHPYSFTPLPEHRIRPYIRNRRDMLREKTGEDYDLYVTEYGWPTAPKDKRGHSVSEKVQAQRTTRTSLMLYAEDAKVLTPHWMGDREQDPTEREHFFGFFHINQHPKPVVIAHAVSARMIDSSRFVGDLWYGPGIGAMLFERKGEYTLALWTAEEDKTADIDVGVPEVTAVDIMGREKKLKTTKGKISQALSGDMLYLTGVAASLAEKAVPPGKDLHADRWSTRLGSFAISRVKTPSQLDGKLDEWTAPVSAVAKNPEDPSNDGQAEVRISYDDNFIYVAARITDGSLEAGDQFEFSIGTRPARQPDMGGSRPYDYAVSVSPPAGGAASKLSVKNDLLDTPYAVKADGDSSGIRWAAQPADGGWTVEMALPIAYLKGFPAINADARISCNLQYGDAGHGKSLKLSTYGAEKPREWPYISFKE